MELESVMEDMNRRLSYQGMNFDQYLQMIGKTKEDFKKDNEEAAKTSCKMRLVLEAVFKDAKLKVTDKEIEEKLEELATMYGRKAEELKDNEELVSRINETIQSEKAIAYVVENAKIKEVAEKKEEKKPAEKKSTAKKEDKKDNKKETTKKATEKKSSKK